MDEDKSKKCNQHQGRQFLSEPLLFLILTLIFIFTPDIYRFKILVIGLLGL